MGWLEPLKVAGVLALSTAQLLTSLLYTLSTPLRWPLYYIYKTVVFLLSPLWIILKLGLRCALFALGLIARLKYLYIYVACAAIIGLCAGLVLHNTSSFFFVLLGLNTAEERQKLVDQYYQKQFQKPRFSLDESRTSSAYDDRLESASFSGDNLDKYGLSSLDKSWPRSSRSRANESMDVNDAFGRRRKLVRTPEFQSRSRRKIGFMAQTIHEESSESDSL